jgi:UbiD family decarboxylase
MYRDLREFIVLSEELGVVRHINDADPMLEIGGITEVAAGMADCPAILFDNIKGYKPGFRIFTNTTVSAQRAALALGLSPKLRPLEALRAWMDKRATLKMIDPVFVNEAPFLENSFRGQDVDLSILPSPQWHPLDGGPYIGSGSLVVMGDAEEGWVNASIYRVQVHGKTQLTIQFDHQGRHGAMISRKYWEKGKPCPIAIVNGQDPSLFIAGFEYLPAGQSEYAFAGAIKGTPIEVFRGPITGLPIPAYAESVLEGELMPMSEVNLLEGPFGEFTAYYAADKKPAPVMKVTAIHHRNDPILLGSPPMKPPRFHFGLPFRGAGIWSNLISNGITDVVGVWQHVSQLMTVIAIEQRYAGHAKRAGMIAAANSYMGRLVVVVDEDVDPSNLADVWAVTTRSEPSEQVDIIRGGWSSSLDPRLTAEDREQAAVHHIRAAGLSSHGPRVLFIGPAARCGMCSYWPGISPYRQHNAT